MIFVVIGYFTSMIFVPVMLECSFREKDVSVRTLLQISSMLLLSILTLFLVVMLAHPPR